MWGVILMQHKNFIYKDGLRSYLSVKAQALFYSKLSLYMKFVLQQTQPGVFQCVASCYALFCAIHTERKKNHEKTYLQQVGERLAECRIQSCFSRKELAERAGVLIDSVKTMERGEAAINIEDAIKICKVLDYSVEYILTGNCGLRGMVRLNQKVLNLPDISLENMQTVAQAFWNTCPKVYR